MNNTTKYFEAHPRQYFGGLAAISLGVLAYAGAKAASLAAEPQPTDKHKEWLAVGAAGIALSVVGLVAETINPQQ